jgi:hypothetical protein
LLVELRKEHAKMQAKAEQARKADPPIPFHFHHAINAAINSLSSTKKTISTAEDLKGLKGFGPHVLSLATTCLHRIFAADPLLSPRPKRPRVKAVSKGYTPRFGSQAFAVLCIMRRHDGCTYADFGKYNDDHSYTHTPFIMGPKGFSANPMHQLAERGLLTGSFESGWALTSRGEDLADSALLKWDKNGGARDDESEHEGEEEGVDGEFDGKEEKKEAKEGKTRGSKRNSASTSARRGKKPRTSRVADDDDFFGAGDFEFDDVEIVSTPSTNGASSGLGTNGASSGLGSSAGSSADSAKTADKPADKTE